ncbi:MAG: urea carboxylase, partial [Proteobacteria bacterium]|nr:urea carboxylase [Pseudomonadota bacterium]
NGSAPFGDTPWLLRPFDRLKFHQVTTDELESARASFPHGAYPIRIEPGSFSLAAHQTDLAAHQADIARFQHTQRAAFEAERAAWIAQGLDAADLPDPPPPPAQTPLAPGSHGVDSPIPGSVWQILHAPGQPITAGETIMIVESMKMEIRIPAPITGIVSMIETAPGQVIRAGQRVAVIAALEAQ